MGTGVRRRRLAGVAEALLIVTGYVIYEALHDLVPRDAIAADRHGLDLLQFEQHLGISVEHAMNQWLVLRPTLGTLTTFWYSEAHFVVTVTLLLATARLPSGRRLRAVLYVTTGVALLVFWLDPTAPPRLLPHGGFVDILAARPSAMTVSNPSIEHLSNPYAAMPSLHAAWAIWGAIVIWHLAGRRSLATIRRSVNPYRTWPKVVVRTVGVIYPATTIWVVLATANHYLTDVTAGAALTAGAYWLTSKVPGCHKTVRPTRQQR